MYCTAYGAHAERRINPVPESFSLPTNIDIAQIGLGAGWCSLRVYARCLLNQLEEDYILQLLKRG
jgi:hypothetical protein